jgi:pimeloyl-ACP methyl ester carboxylesterase
MHSLSESTICLQDGRSLAYEEYGDLQGKPVFFFHGAPGSRTFHPWDELTRRLGVRIITTDRPGYGQSTFQPGRRLLDWPKDIAQLADSLGIRKFAIAGHSGGGPHALASAYALTDRVTVTATLSGVGPIETPGATEDMFPINKFGFRYGRYIPWLIGRAIMGAIFHERCIDPAKAFDHDKTRPPSDQALMDQPEIRELCINSEVEAFQHGIDGYAWDVRLITSPWGFPIKEIQVPVQIWHGTADNAASIRMAKYMAESIPNSHLNIYPDEGHMLLLSHWEEILTQLIME